MFSATWRDSVGPEPGRAVNYASFRLAPPQALIGGLPRVSYALLDWRTGALANRPPVNLRGGFRNPSEEAERTFKQVQNSGLSNPIQPISSSGARRHPPERQRLRVFSLPAPFVRTNSILMASLDQPPVALESNMDKNEVISLLGPPPPPPATVQCMDTTVSLSPRTEPLTLA